MTTKDEQQKIAKSVNGLLGIGELNWLTDYNRELKKEQFNVFFHKRSNAEKALTILSKYGNVKILKTPSFVNTYFQYSVNVIFS